MQCVDTSIEGNAVGKYVSNFIELKAFDARCKNADIGHLNHAQNKLRCKSIVSYNGWSSSSVFYHKFTPESYSSAATVHYITRKA